MRWIALLPAAAGLLLVGCGAEAAVDPVADASSALEQAGTARVALLIEGEPAGQGVLDARSRRAQLVLDLTEIEGFEGRREHASYKVIVDGRHVYMEVGFLVPKLEGKWLRSEDLPRGQLQPFADPSELLGLLEEAADGVEEQGSERVRGMETTRYDGTLPERTINELGDADERSPFSIWVDGDGLARRLSFDDPAWEKPHTITIEYYDFGAPVTVVLPPAESIVSEEEMQRACDESSDDEASFYCFSGDGVTDYEEIEEVE